MGCDGRPAVGYGVCSLSLLHSLGICHAAVCAEESVPAGVKAVHGRIDRVDRIVIPAFSVFGFVVDGGADDLHFPGA